MEPSTRKPRADVVRNRTKILDVAERHFEEFGVTTSLEAIAKEAGVGPGTLYRHFPSREALLACLLQVRRNELANNRAPIDLSGDHDEVLRAWIVELENYFSLYRGLSEPYLATLREQDPDNPLAQSCDDLVAITDEYLRVAQRDGSARLDINGRDLFLAANSIAWLKSVGVVDELALDRLRAIVESGYRDHSRTRSH